MFLFKIIFSINLRHGLLPIQNNVASAIRSKQSLDSDSDD